MQTRRETARLKNNELNCVIHKYSKIILNFM